MSCVWTWPVTGIVGVNVTVRLLLDKDWENVVVGHNGGIGVAIAIDTT